MVSVIGALRPRPVRLPSGPGLSVRHQALLAAEILVAYADLLRQLRSNKLENMVAAARTTRLRPLSVAEADEHDTAIRLGWIVQRVLGVLPTDKRCLIRSLVVLRLLAHRSIDGRLIIGVHVGEGFKAHAWVEHAERPILPAGSFQRLVEV